MTTFIPSRRSCLGSTMPIIISKLMGNKFLFKWDGSYVVQEVYTNRAYKIIDENELRIGFLNGKFLKR